MEVESEDSSDLSRQSNTTGTAEETGIGISPDSDEWGAPYDWITLENLEPTLSAFKERCATKYDGDSYTIDITLYDEGTFKLEASHWNPIFNDDEYRGYSEVVEYQSETNVLEKSEVLKPFKSEHPISYLSNQEVDPFDHYAGAGESDES